MFQNAEHLIFIVIYRNGFCYLYNRKDQGPHELKNKVFGDFLDPWHLVHF